MDILKPHIRFPYRRFPPTKRFKPLRQMFIRKLISEERVITFVVNITAS